MLGSIQICARNQGHRSPCSAPLDEVLTRFVPNPLYGVFSDLQMLGHLAARPMLISSQRQATSSPWQKSAPVTAEAYPLRRFSAGSMKD